MSRNAMVTQPVAAGSNVDRWAQLVVDLLDAEEDPKTFEHWGRHVHMSVSTLRQVCRAARVPGKPSLDFARLLRAVAWLQGRDWLPEAVLSCCDSRTLRGLFRRAGCGDGRNPLTLKQFLARQSLLDANGPHLLAVRTRLANSARIYDRKSVTISLDVEASRGYVLREEGV